MKRAGATTSILPPTLYHAGLAPWELDAVRPTWCADAEPPRSGERGLLLAVLRDGLETWMKYRGLQGKYARLLFAEADAWIASTTCRRLYDFEVICNVLGLSASYIRRRLAAMPARPVLTVVGG